MATTEGNPQTYKLGSQDNDINQHFEDAIDVIQQHSDNRVCYEYETDYRYYEPLGVLQQPALCQISCCLLTHPSDAAGHAPVYEWTDATQTWPQGVPDVSLGHPATSESPQFYSILPPIRNGKGRKKLRLYEYLHEALSDPNMGDSIQWTDSVSGTFHFISKNKEKLAECWGQRKGNRKTMTYQKMARALRNYSRTGEIVKVRRKLTYRFNPTILQRLGVAGQMPSSSRRGVVQEEQVHHHHSHEPNHVPPEPGYYSSVPPPEWHGWYGHYSLQDDSYDLATCLTSHTAAKL